MAESSRPGPKDLEALGRSRFGELTEAELRLLRTAPHGKIAFCGPAEKPDDPSNDPANSDGWGSEREIRADLIRWVCVDHEAVRSVDPRGVQILAAKVTGTLNLSFVSIAFPLLFWRCYFSQDVDFKYASVPHLNLTGTWMRSLAADAASMPGGVTLRRGFFSKGEVRLLGAHVGQLDCSGGRFENPDRTALVADGMKVEGGVLFTDGFSAEGEVRLLGAGMTNGGGHFKNPSGMALAFDHAQVAGTVFLNEGFYSEGEVRLLGAQIGRNFDCAGGVFRHPSGRALNGDGIAVGGAALLNKGFSAEGEVPFVGAHILGNLECDGGTFRNSAGVAFNCENVQIGGHIFLRDNFSAESVMMLFGARIGGGLSCTKARFSAFSLNTATVRGIFDWSRVQGAQELRRLDLRNSSIGTFQDDESSWPEKGKLNIDGLTYAHLTEVSTDVRMRLRWLERAENFTLQPYRQLAKVLRETGNDSGAREVLFQMEDRRRKGQNRRGYLRCWDWILNATIGYGLKPSRALGWLLGLTLLGVLFHGCGYLGGAIVPTEKEAYDTFEYEGHPPSYYPRFNAIAYSFKHTFPLIALGVKEHWHLNRGWRELRRKQNPPLSRRHAI